MKRPDWVPSPAWAGLEAALGGDPARADTLREMKALTARWDDATRIRFIEAFRRHATCGLPPTAAMVSAAWDLLESDGRDRSLR